MVRQVVAYIDGFNLYHGLKDKHGRKYLWLDLELLVNRLLLPDQVFNRARYFTASVRNDTKAEFRQRTYLNALAAHCKYVTTVEGRFQEKEMGCHKCGARWRSYEEKETDISIAIAMIEDAVKGDFDVALVISADSDLVPAIKAVKRLRPSATVVCVFPPKRRSDELRRAADAAFPLGEGIIRKSLLPETVTRRDGQVFTRPRLWR